MSGTRAGLHRKAGIFLLLVVVLGGCGKPRPGAEPRPVTRIEVLPVIDPAKLSTENRNLLGNILYADWLHSVDNMDKSKRFSEKMADARTTFGHKMTAALLEELASQGYETGLYEGSRGTEKDPDDVDYTKLQTDAHVLHVWYDEVGLYSSRFSKSYVPRVNIIVRLVDPKTDDYLYDERLYYGADARGEKYWSVPGDPKYHYENFDALFKDPNEVVEGLDAGIHALARHTVKELKRVQQRG